MQSKDDLLSLALNSLNKEVKEDKRNRIYKKNQDAIITINSESSTSTKVGNLEIKPSINGDADSQSSLPLISASSFDIDLSKISLPTSLGGGTLKNTIKSICDKYNIEYKNNDLNKASFVPVVTSIAGQHAIEDVPCDGVTKAEFVPVYNSNFNEKRVLAIVFSSNGETKLRTDLMKVGNKMTCLDRSNNSPTALQAIEIPNDTSLQLQQENPEIFKALQNNSCVVVFVEFGLESYKGFSNNYYSAGFRGGNTRGGDNYESTRGISKGVSAYSFVGQGSNTEDNSQTISESGTRKLSKISVYTVGTMVVNTNGQDLTSEQSKTVVKMMQLRAEELGKHYKKCKLYTYYGLVNELNEYLQKYDVSTKSDIFEHSMLQIAEVTENPTECHFSSSELTPENFFIDLGISNNSILQFNSALKKRFGEDFCDYISKYNKVNTYAIRLPLAKVFENMGAIQKSIDDILINPRNLQAYQKYSRRESDTFGSLSSRFKEIMQEAGISINYSDCAEIVLLKMFGCEEELHKARCTPGKDYVGKVMDTHFYFDISEKAAKAVVAKINQQFPNLNGQYPFARFIRSDARVEDKGNIDLCEIVIDTAFLCSKEFLAQYKNALNSLIEDNPLLYEQLRIQSGTQFKTSKEFANQISSLAQHILDEPKQNSQTEEAIKAKQELVGSLLKFSTVLNSKQAKRKERLEANDNVRKSLAFFESKQNGSENEEFKKGDKMEIKEVQKSLGLRK